MTKHIVKPEIIVDADGPIQARNVILKILAGAELSGMIYSFKVPEAVEG